MAYNHEYPYVDPNRYNSDWILNKIKELEGEMTTFEALNKITFDGEWNISKQYPAWCIVNTNGGTEGYISLKPVPAGVLITNTEYWTSVVNYTATIADLQNRVVALEGDMLAAQSDISALDTRLDNAENPLYIFIADSYGDAASLGTDPFQYYLPTYSGIDNADIITSAVAGAGFSRTAKFEDQLTAVISTLSTEDKKRPAYIYFVGCINDINDLINNGNLTATFTGMQNCSDIIDANFEHVMVKAIIPCGIGVGSGQVNLLDNYNDYIYYIKNDCQSHGLSYVEYSECVIGNYGYLNNVDHLHPNADGSKAIARFIANLLRGDCSSYASLGLIQGTKSAALGGGSFNIAQVRKSGEMASVYTLNGISNLSFTTPPTLSGYNPMITLGTFNDHGMVRGHKTDDRPSFIVPGCLNNSPQMFEFFFNTDNTIKVRLPGHFSSVACNTIKIPFTVVPTLAELL